MTKRREGMNFLKNFIKDESGQDLIEYTLLMAFIALASASIFLGAGGSVSAIWTSGSSTLVNAATAAS
jgi:Flp pilus assembly pilin Flp